MPRLKFRVSRGPSRLARVSLAADVSDLDSESEFEVTGMARVSAQAAQQRLGLGSQRHRALPGAQASLNITLYVAVDHGASA